MRAVDIIQKKRDKQALSDEEIRFFIEGLTAGDIADYQASALLMAIYLNGMNREETVTLTLAMAESGQMMDLSDISDYIVLAIKQRWLCYLWLLPAMSRWQK
ncbi:MAG: hypothetical protein ACPG7F_06965 [Aggregatilineales bacterium]